MTAAPPLPPQDIDSRKPLTETLVAGTELHRFFARRWKPLHFDRASAGRFNAPDASYGVLYAATSLNGAFAETFLRQPGRTYIPTDLLAEKAYVRLRVDQPLVLARLAGRGLARIGATAEVTHGGLPYNAARAWSKALHGHAQCFDGLLYTARHDDEAGCVALFDRAAPAVTVVERVLDLDQDWLWRLAELYGIGIPP